MIDLIMADEEGQKEHTYSKKPMWQWVVLYLVIGAIIYGVIYYFLAGDKGGYTNPTNETYNNTPTSNVTGGISPTVQSPTSSSPSASQEITVEGNEFAFSPENITVKQGQEVKLTFKNTGEFPHNYAIADLDVLTKTIQGGGEDIVTFTPNEAGNFTITCEVPGHADRGMTGILTVE